MCLICRMMFGLLTGKLEASSWEEKLKPLASEVQAIKEASVSNDFVDTVVKTIPEEALTRYEIEYCGQETKQ